MENENKDQENQENENQKPENQESSEDQNQGSPDDQNQRSPEDQNQGSADKTVRDTTSGESSDLEKATVPSPSSENDVEEEPEVTLRSHSIKFGLIIGLIGVIVTVLLYIIDPPMLANVWLGFVFLVLYIGIIIYAGINYRNQIGGYLDFGKAFMHGFLALLIAGIIGTAFQILLYNVIDPGLGETVSEVAVENARAIMERFGAPEDQMDEALEKARTDTLDGFSITGLMKGYLWAIIFYAIAALISGAIVKRKLPESDFV